MISSIVQWKHRLSLCCLAVFILSALTRLSAQSLSNPIGMGLGASSVTSAENIDAIGTNPALLAPRTKQDSTTSLFFTLGAVGGMVGESALKLSDFSTYFRKVNNERRVLTDTELRTVSSLLDGSRLGGQIDATLIAAVLQTNLGAFAFSTSLHGQMGVQLPQGLAQILQGYDAAQRLRLEGMAGSAFGYGSIQLGYANHIVLPEMSDSTNALASLRVGATAQYLIGYAFEEISSARLDLAPIPVTDFPTTTYNIRANLDYTLRSAGTAFLVGNQVHKDPTAILNQSYGNGVGASLGASASLRLPGSKIAAWQIAFSLTDIGGITWNKARLASVSFQDTIKSILPLATDSTYLQRLRDTTNRSEAVTRSLPTRFHLGFAFDYGAYFGLPTPLILSFQYTQGLNTSGFNTTQPRFGLGFAWENKGWMPSLRTGIGIGGQEEILWSCGLGWNVAEGAFVIDAALANLLPLLDGGKGTWIGGSLRLKGRIEW